VESTKGFLVNKRNGQISFIPIAVNDDLTFTRCGATLSSNDIEDVVNKQVQPYACIACGTTVQMTPDERAVSEWIPWGDEWFCCELHMRRHIKRLQTEQQRAEAKLKREKKEEEQRARRAIKAAKETKARPALKDNEESRPTDDDVHGQIKRLTNLIAGSMLRGCKTIRKMDVEIDEETMKSRGSFNEAYKKEMASANAVRCEMCGWDAFGAWKKLIAHHIIPIAFGGKNTPDNIVVLCPNHHMTAHAVCAMTRETYTGPTTREELLHMVNEFEQKATLVKEKLSSGEASMAELSEEVLKPVFDDIRQAQKACANPS